MAKINDEYDIGAAFEAIENELIASMIRNFEDHKLEEMDEKKRWSMWQTEMLHSLEKYKHDNQKKYGKQFKDINKKIEALISLARSEGGMNQEKRILEAIKNGFPAKRIIKGGTAEFFKINDRKLEALIQATTSDMQKAEAAVLRMANDQYRKIIYNAQVYANTGAGTYEKAVDMATKDFLSAGLNCIQYTNGARHTIADYADMAIRTASKRAYLQGEGEMRQQWGLHLVIMNKRGDNPCPQCLPFVGKIMIDDVWSGGSRKDGNYPLMSSAVEAGLYHPRCRDAHTTYFPGITTVDSKYNKKEIADLEEQAKQEARQQYAERQVKRFGRLAGYSLDPENQQRYEQKRKEWKTVAVNLSAGESANIENLRNGNNKVSLSYIDTETYRRKFNQITSNTSVNDALRKYSKAMLTHRNGTDGEDLHIISSKTGKRLFSKTTGSNELGVELSKDEIQNIKQFAKDEGVIALHNHPTNLLPTGSDFVSAGARGYDFGLIATHDGRVFWYKAGDKPFRSEYFNKTVDKYVSEPYNYDIEKAQIKTLSEFKREFGIEWRELN